MIEAKLTFKYLDLILDENLNRSNHISTLHNKIKSSTRFFYFLKNLCNSSLLRLLYFALVNFRLQYGIHCYGGTFSIYVDKLKISQNHIERLILNCLKEKVLIHSFAIWKYYIFINYLSTRFYVRINVSVKNVSILC